MDSTMLMASLTAVSIFGVLLFATKNCWSKKVNFAIGNVIKEVPGIKFLGPLKVPSVKINLV